MCGIAGVFWGSRPAARDRVEAQIHRIAHRGPDDTGFFLEGGVGLGHARLAIIDPAGGQQPLFSPDGRLALVANAEIYNYRELRQALQNRGCRFRTGSDCEVILHAYAVYGEAFLDHLEGMFAFALYDRDRQRLLLVRDRLGIKPLYLAPSGPDLAFASEIKGLFPALPHRPEEDPLGIAQYLQNQFPSGRTTGVRGVERVLPGEVVTVEHGTVRERRRYWQPWTVEPAYWHYDEAAGRFDELMATVIPQHLRADVPYGLFLSGGIDSPLLLALLSRYADGPVRTFSAGFTGERYPDELPHARDLAQHFGARHTPLRLEPEALLSRLGHSIWAADDPMRDNANLPTSLLAEAAGTGLKVVLTGEGGDEAFAGYGRYRAPRLERRLKGLLRPGSGGFRTRGLLPGSHAHWLVRPTLRAEIARSRGPFRDAWQAAPRSWSDLQRMQGVDLTTALPDNLLTKVDRMLMARGVEGRVPLVDRRLIEFGLALPDALKVGERRGKTFLRRWAGSYLPAQHLDRPKRGFRVPVADWLQGPFLDRLEACLVTQPSIRSWFHPRGIRRLCARQRRRGTAAAPLWALLQLALWHRLIIQEEGASAPPEEDPLELLR